MRGLKTWAWAVVIAATATPASAQLTSGTTGGTTGTSGLTGTTGTGGISGSTTSRTTSTSGNSLGGSSLNSSSSGLGSSNSSNSSSGMNSSNNGLANLDASNSQFTNIGITGTSSLQKSNVFASFYANPYAMGLSSSAGAGGFGQPTFGTTSTTTTGGGRTGATGTAGRTGGLNSNAANQSGILIPLPVQLAYSAQVQFPTPKVATPRLQADLRGIIDAGGLASPAGVQIVADANNNVTLRGTVKDDDEKRLAEGLVRLTPGVGTITNELTYPVASK